MRFMADIIMATATRLGKTGRMSHPFPQRPQIEAVAAGFSEHAYPRRRAVVGEPNRDASDRRHRGRRGAGVRSPRLETGPAGCQDAPVAERAAKEAPSDEASIFHLQSGPQ